MIKQQFIGLVVSFLFCNGLFAQEQFSKFSLSGYKVKIVPSETFSLDIANHVEAKKEIFDGGILRLGILDQRGKVPKDTITIYMNKISYLDLHNCEVESMALLSTDSLTIRVAASFGSLQVETDYLSVNIGGGGNLMLTGTANYFDCAAGAGSSLDASELLVEDARIDVRGQGSAKVHVKKIQDIHLENGSVENIYIQK